MRAAQPERHGTNICLITLRHGTWPAWSPILLRTMEVQRSIRFLLIGDEPPAVHRWPANVLFQNISLEGLRERLQRALPLERRRAVRVPSMVSAGAFSKISDFKPMLGLLVPELLVGCAFWGYVQEDVLLGDLRGFLSDDVLGRSDTISPVAHPKSNFGPFMMYRRTPTLLSLPFRSKDCSH